jgi:Ca2+-binding EF-hand superfamily protein
MSSITSATTNSYQMPDLAAMRKQAFEKTDADSSGSISESELETAIKNGPNADGASDADAPDVSTLFKTLDTDGDNQISEDEMAAGQQAQGPGPGGTPPNMASGPNADGTGRVLNTKV